jgi:hypothetical protein
VLVLRGNADHNTAATARFFFKFQKRIFFSVKSTVVEPAAAVPFAVLKNNYKFYNSIYEHAPVSKIFAPLFTEILLKWNNVDLSIHMAWPFALGRWIRK